VHVANAGPAALAHSKLTDAMNTLLAISYVALLIAIIVGFFWALLTLAELRRGQARLQRTVDRIARSVGSPPRPEQAVIICERCGAEYSAELTGCDQCGRAKPKDAVAHYPM